jgi:hypothetical protein
MDSTWNIKMFDSIGGILDRSNNGEAKWLSKRLKSGSGWVVDVCDAQLPKKSRRNKTVLETRSHIASEFVSALWWAVQFPKYYLKPDLHVLLGMLSEMGFKFDSMRTVPIFRVKGRPNYAGWVMNGVSLRHRLIMVTWGLAGGMF